MLIHHNKNLSFNNVNLLVVGNSISTGDYGTSWLNQLVPMLDDYNPTYHNSAVSGQTITQMLSLISTQVTPYFVNDSNKRNIAFNLTESNDVGYMELDYGLPQAIIEAYNNIANYNNILRRAGWEVITSDMLPRNDRSDINLLLPLNTMLSNNYQKFADGYIALRSVVGLNDYNSSLFTSDNVHTNTSGNYQIALQCYNKLKGIYGIL